MNVQRRCESCPIIGSFVRLPIETASMVMFLSDPWLQTPVIGHLRGSEGHLYSETVHQSPSGLLFQDIPSLGSGGVICKSEPWMNHDLSLKLHEGRVHTLYMMFSCCGVCSKLNTNKWASVEKPLAHPIICVLFCH